MTAISPIPSGLPGASRPGGAKGIPSLDTNMDQSNSPLWQKADGWTNGNPFNNGWRADNINFIDGHMILRLDDDNCPDTCSGKPYASGEYRTRQFYGYGQLEGRLKAAKGDGLVTSLFFYTGPSDGNPWDEIDVEILGKDTSKMQINYYTNGVGNHEKMIDLGFDAAQGFNKFAILWEQNSIRWYINDRLVHTENGSNGALPTHAGKIMVNLWPGIGVDGWLKPFKYSGPVTAEYDWIKFTPLEQTAVSTLITTPPTTQTPDQAPRIGPLYLFRPDPEIGVVQPSGRADLRGMDITEKVSLDQIEAVLQTVSNLPVAHVLNSNYSWTTIKARHQDYPELEAIQGLDENYNYKFYWYFSDFRTYWGNAITTLSAFVQKSLGENQLDKMGKALEFAKSFRKKIKNQTQADRVSVSHNRYSPSDYSLALLDLTEAEIRAQTKSWDENFYLEGINLALSGIEALAFKKSEKQLAKPDYFTIIKGILTLADLNQQAGLLTAANPIKSEKYFETAKRLYGSVAGLQNNLPNLKPKGLHVYLGYETRIDVEPADIHEALKFNRDQGYLLPEDGPKAETGIFHYLKGVALIKDAGLFSTRPNIKTIDEILLKIEQLEQGVNEIEMATTEKDEKNILFYKNLTELIKGNLFLALADRINLLGAPLSQEIKDKLGEINFDVDFIASTDVNQQNYGIAQILIEEADYHFSGIPADYKYLYAWSQVKRLEIAIRRADFSKETPLGRIADATDQLKFVDDNVALFEGLSAGQPIRDYLNIEYDYLRTILMLIGKIDPKTTKKITDPHESLIVIRQLEADIQHLPIALQTYFRNYLKLKEVSALTQISEEKGVGIKKREELLARAKQLLKEVERETAPIIPPYLWHNFTKTLPALLNAKTLGWKEAAQAENICLALDLFTEGHIKENYSAENYKDVRNQLTTLEEQIKKRQFSAAESTRALLEKKLDGLSPAKKFKADFGDQLAWDLPSLYAELYHEFAVLYAYKKEGSLFYQYVQSAYMECGRSHSTYDRKSRYFFIYEMEIAPDDSVPELKGMKAKIAKPKP